VKSSPKGFIPVPVGRQDDDSLWRLGVLGYEKSPAIAKNALKTGGSVYNLIIAKGWLTKEKLDELLKPENMTHPRLNPQ